MMRQAQTQVLRLRVLLVDDNPAYRTTVRRILSTARDLEVVGEAEDGRASLTQASILKPDIVILDCAMPEMDGPDAARALRRLYPAIRIIGLSVGDDEECVRRMLVAGAERVVYKDDAMAGIAQAIARA